MAGKKRLVRWLTSLALGALVALPEAAAQVKCFTDSRGVIHITNDAGPREISRTDPGLPEPTAPKDKNDKLRIFYERRGKQLPVPSEAVTDPLPEGGRSQNVPSQSTGAGDPEVSQITPEVNKTLD
jgi:hypothetical protein